MVDFDQVNAGWVPSWEMLIESQQEAAEATSVDISMSLLFTVNKYFFSTLLFSLSILSILIPFFSFLR